MGGCARNSASPLALLGELERGSRGVLYRARDGRSGRLVSVRVPPAAWPRESLLLAAARAAALCHPHIAPVLEAGWHDDAAYVIFDEELGARVNPTRLSPREAAVIVRDAATAVAYAAGRGLAHPGLVPDLLRFTPEGRVVVTGYELPGPVPGPELYLAPEVRNGGAVDAAANVYSLGAILYVLAAGRGVPEDLEPLIRAAMDVDPRRRPSAAALAAELARRLECPDGPRRRAWYDALQITGLLALLLLGLTWPFPAGKAVAVSVPPSPVPKPEPEKVVEPTPIATPPVAVELRPIEAPSKPVSAPPKAVERPPPARVGTVRHVHPAYGVFVALEAGSKVRIGDALEVVRDGRATVLVVRQLSRPERIYPHGAAVCDASDAAVEKGQIVRRRARASTE